MRSWPRACSRSAPSPSGRSSRPSAPPVTPSADSLLFPRDASPACGHRGADDAGVVEQSGRLDAGADAGEQRHPLLRLLADPAADDDQFGGDQRLHDLQVLGNPLGPLLPAPAVLDLAVLGGALLRVLAPDLQVPEL